jgi:hypothetical protein
VSPAPPDGRSRGDAGDMVAGEAAGTERRRRRERVFGDVLPERTGDEIGAGWGEPYPTPGAGDSDAGEEWLRREVPPHHG